MKKGNKEKSNRAQADFFELLVCQYICHLYKITFSYSEDLAKLLNKVLAMESGEKRLKLQNDNFIKIQPEIKKILDDEISRKGKIINVIWTGRHFVIEQSTSDVDAEHSSKKKTRFSIKSIAKSGTGTLKNLGLGKLEKWFGFSFKDQTDKMWWELQNYIRKTTDKNTAKRGELKKLAQKNKKVLEWAKRSGKIFQSRLNGVCLEKFNSLSPKQKREFLNFITDCHDEDLYVIIVNDSGVAIYKPVDKTAKLRDRIIAKKENGSDVGYTIYINKIPTYRVQTNNTNGIGISAFCQRIFLI
jgi:succinate dehydrogenase flavin-adding protein (antitoxin of CptAB toxin-antitoxin module)